MAYCHTCGVYTGEDEKSHRKHDTTRTKAEQAWNMED